jgi:NitT/TauT family transport system substrate-binding protein
VRTGMRLLLALLLPAIGVLGATGPVRAQTSELRIAVQPGILFYSMWIMKQAGLAERQAAKAGQPGLKVNWLTMSSGGANADALLSGSVDVVAGGTSNLLVVWSKSKGAVKAISAVSGVPNVLLTRDPSVRTLKDFTDKNRIAVPTIKMSLQAIYLQMALEQEFGEGSFKKFDSMMVQLGHPQATLALLDPRNPVDSHFSGPPFMQTALKNPAIHRILTSVDLVGPSTSLLAYTTAKFYDANPKMIDIFVAALNGANQLIQSEPKKAAQYYLDATGEKYSVDEIVAMVGEPGTLFTTVPKGTMKFAEFMHKVGTLDRKPASWKDYFFPSIHAANGD